MFYRCSPSHGPNSPEVHGFYHSDTGSIQYLVHDTQSHQAALIDAVLDFDPARAGVSTESVEEILKFAEERSLDIVWALDTHPHADHLMASSWLGQQCGARTGIGRHVNTQAELWEELYNMPQGFHPENDFDCLFDDDESFSIGSLPVRVKWSPGHTPSSVSYIVGDDAAFVHDTFMHVDSGTARADFPGASAGQLYDTLQSILALPDDTRLFVGHDYCTETRNEPAWESTVRGQRAENTHVGGNVSRADFIHLREERDRSLALPDRMLHVLQMNLHGGRLPACESDGHSYLKIPLNRFLK